MGKTSEELYQEREKRINDASLTAADGHPAAG
jgi:hypothetical protein